MFDTKSVGDLPLAVEKRYSLEYLEDIGKTPIILMKGIPDLQAPVRWAVMLETREYDLKGNSAETREVARIDNYHENKPTHIHRGFEEGAPEEEMRHLSFHEAREYLEDNCEDFVKKYFNL